jgi:CBS domain-containing protein
LTLFWCAAYSPSLAKELAEVEGSSAVQYVREIEGRKKPGAHIGQRLAYLTQDGTLEEMLELVIERKVHRAYIIDGEGKPLAIATLTDLLYSFAGEQAEGRPQLKCGP